MAISFKSAQRRTYWLAMGFGLLCDYVLIAVILLVAFAGNPYAWLWALIFLIAMQGFLLLYAFFNFLKRLVWYHLSEKEERAEIIASEFQRLNFPRPESYYNDADQYLTEVSLSPATSPEAALFAGTLLGAMQAHRLNGPRSEAFFLTLAIERAMKKMLPWERAAEWKSVR